MPPNMSPDELARWRTKQIAALIAIGINPLDAHNQVRRFLALLPYGADPDHYVPPANALEQDLTRPEIAADLRAAWYGDENVKPRFKRILDSEGKS